MAQSREGSLENLKVTLEALKPTDLKQVFRGYVNRDSMGEGDLPFATIVNATDIKEERGSNSVRVVMEPTIEVHTKDMTSTQMEALYLTVWKEIIKDVKRGGFASNTIVGAYDPIDYLSHVQGFTLGLQIILLIQLDQM